jgi:hypothetical protein
MICLMITMQGSSYKCSESLILADKAKSETCLVPTRSTWPTEERHNKSNLSSAGALSESQATS